MTSWSLGNGETRNAENPDRFWIPEKWERMALEPGMLVKLIFEFIDGGERMWVEVIDVDYEMAGYSGRLVNTPICSDDLNYGDMVVFKPEHVIDIQEK
jgi:hypothetical protein